MAAGGSKPHECCRRSQETAPWGPSQLCFSRGTVSTHPICWTSVKQASHRPWLSSLGTAGQIKLSSQHGFDLQLTASPLLSPLDGIYYGDNRFDTVSESGTATLKARPRVRPLLTFLPLVSTVLLCGLRVCSGPAT